MTSNISTQLLIKGIQPLEIFTGPDDQDPITWIQAIDELFDATKVDINDRRRLLPMYFGNDVKKWYRSEEFIRYYDEFKKQFINAFTSSVYKLKISTKLMNRRQSHNESVQSYYCDILSLCARLNPDMQDDEKILYLLRGLKPSIQQQVIMVDPKKCKDVFEHAKRAEAAASLTTSSSTESTTINEAIDETTAALRHTSMNSNNRQSDHFKWNSSVNQRDSNCYWPQHRYNDSSQNNRYGQFIQKDPSRFRCYNCHGIGHYAYQCPSHLN
ncbi:unnamed protein product [Rotaria socialis]|uniref:CCHC-type domain-containing protein n=1 Tax=Rotaria socialis TaxID=392032 RepID=A0A820TY08_9BILA|nr:unnamed protein product [Rotaria socialis]CAF3343863.1 unnamed protein product [Rotaria socialis]CAF3734226.1 unnamed protein product [Rotaria socialis]CAF4383092.1 unnamed protein product [Rotaria socialis]CAF4475275.1 unnamed protein product [Rotaria socialis]